MLRKRAEIAALGVAPVAWLASVLLALAAPSGLTSTERIVTDCRAVWADHNYLSFDDRMALAAGTWGRSVHGPGPSFLRFQRENQRQKDAVVKCLNRG